MQCNHIYCRLRHPFSQIKFESLQVKDNKEPSIAQMKEMLLDIYSEKDEESLEILCVRYEGRSAELEQYLEKHFKDIPTKLEVKQTNARAGLEAELKSLQDYHLR